MSSHGVAKNADSFTVQGQCTGQQGWQFIHHVIVHPVVPGPGFLLRIHVETRAEPEIVGGLRIIGYAFSPWAGIRSDERVWNKP